MSNVYMAADPHFNDEQIIMYERPQFKNVEEMNQFIIEGWKRNVGENDIIFLLGDVGIDGKKSLHDIIYDLPGEKHLIMGNHDMSRRPYEWVDDIGFDYVYQYPICYDNFYWLSHDTMYLNKQMPYANIHGHIHANTMVSAGEINQYINVSWEKLIDGPMNFLDIKKLFTIERSYIKW